MWKFERSRLRSLRDVLGLAQDEFAATIGTSKQHVSKWETGKLYPSVWTLIKICNTFSVGSGPGYFFTNQGGDHDKKRTD